MYEDKDFWPIKCFKCGEEFAEEIGGLKTATMFRCPSCGLNFHHPTEQFLLALSEAREGRLNPWRDMLRLSKPE
jgi:DNA-directed RNA polymerase subunit N (RpoN/RPB10)